MVLSKVKNLNPPPSGSCFFLSAHSPVITAFRRFCKRTTSPVVPEPAKGSKTKPLGGHQSWMIFWKSLRGLTPINCFSTLSLSSLVAIAELPPNLLSRDTETSSSSFQ
ncbi:10898_t:CDS:2 [Ambispora leptoticha]|uniref:10898_t:CDS:1 n=1 Tax=Ambispora leptoticha TaxID=144679 RepID=A0A9N9FCQ7_9GLOM|nr:10898_t:CDS:2 [Ambispora leptoticha]